MDEVQGVRNCTKFLTRRNVSKIIALGHAGINMDKKIATEIPEVDIVVGGHTNTFLYTGISRSVLFCACLGLFKAPRQPSQKFWPKILTSYFFTAISTYTS